MTSLHNVLAAVQKAPRKFVLVLLALTVLLGWVYAPTLWSLVGVWTSDPQYSHGYVVPLFSLVLLWIRRDRLVHWKQGGSWWGVALLLLAGLVRLTGGFLAFDWLEAVAMLPTLAGLAVLLGGWGGLGWSWPAIGFLIFMVPLPHRVAFALSGPLRDVATKVSTYTLQTMGLPALAEGNIIVVNANVIAVAEACSGLSMLFVFVAIAAAVAILSRRPLLDRILVLASAFPIAVLANVMRITTTAVAYEVVGRKAGDVIFHDLAGWLMMPLALGMIWLVLKLVDLLLVLPPPKIPMAPVTAPADGVRSAKPGKKSKERGRKNVCPNVPGLKA